MTFVTMTVIIIGSIIAGVAILDIIWKKIRYMNSILRHI